MSAQIPNETIRPASRRRSMLATAWSPQAADKSPDSQLSAMGTLHALALSAPECLSEIAQPQDQALPGLQAFDLCYKQQYSHSIMVATAAEVSKTSRHGCTRSWTLYSFLVVQPTIGLVPPRLLQFFRMRLSALESPTSHQGPDLRFALNFQYGCSSSSLRQRR